MGIDLDRLFLVRPPADGSRPEIWAAEQLLRSGCFGLVVLQQSSTQGADFARSLSRSKGHVLARAAEKGQCTALVLGARPTRDIPAEVRLQTGGGRVSVLRDRTGIPGSSAALPPWWAGTDPLE
jgi:hypothetical protein